MADNNSSSTISKMIVVVAAVLVCCACLLIGVAGYMFYKSQTTHPSGSSPFLLPNFGNTTPNPPVELNRPATGIISTDTLDALLKMEVPENDPYELSCRLKQLCDVPRIVPGNHHQVGAVESFWVLDADTVTYNQVVARLVYITPHTYFWAEQNLNVDESDVKRLMDTFEDTIYPTDREFFGSEWMPGVDGDEHIYVIYTGGLGSNIAGGFDTTDEYNPLVEPHSNAHESFMISSSQDLSNEYTYSTLAHEFVHMIQHPTDRNDASWMTEGFAEVGVFVNGYTLGGADWEYIQSPDVQLNDWVDHNSPLFGAHYGQSSLYLIYFLDRFGKEVTKYLSTNPLDDLVSIDDTLVHFNSTDSQTGQVMTADDVFMDWAAALYLRDGTVGDGRYTYHNYLDAPQTQATENLDRCPQDAVSRSVNQYGIDYIRVQCQGDYTLTFTGSTAVGLIAEQPHSGQHAFWSNKGNESDMTLTREFDLSAVSGSVTLDYWTWYDIEKDWDYLYVEASTDGKNWTILKPPSGTDYNPSGASFGWAYTGQSVDWVEERLDLSMYAGQTVQIRFEYVTDAMVNGHGFLLDDVSIEAIQYRSDFEADDGGWIPAGFVRAESMLPQTYRLSLIIKGADTTVTPVELNSANTVDVPLSLKQGEEAVLIVTGTTRFTTIPAAYQIEIK